ncbi:MAG: nuclear transport factor 2 family protein [Pyrinomonadaceae bacterium]
MKRIFMILMIAIAASSVAIGQARMSKDANKSLETQIVALDKAGWEAWKNKNAAWYQTNVTEDFLNITSEGVSNKSQFIKDLTICEVKSFAFDNFKFVMLDKGAVLMTYTAIVDGVCGGKTIPANVRSSVVYVKRDGKWLESLYMETPIAQ